MKRIALLMTLVGGALCLGVLFAQQKGEPQLHVVTYVDVYPNFAADTAKLLQQFAADNRKDTGFVRFEALRDVAALQRPAVRELG